MYPTNDNQCICPGSYLLQLTYSLPPDFTTYSSILNIPLHNLSCTYPDSMDPYRCATDVSLPSDNYTRGLLPADQPSLTRQYCQKLYSFQRSKSTHSSKEGWVLRTLLVLRFGIYRPELEWDLFFSSEMFEGIFKDFGSRQMFEGMKGWTIRLRLRMTDKSEM